MSSEEAAILRISVARLLGLHERGLTPIIQLSELAKWIDANEDKDWTPERAHAFRKRLVLTIRGQLMIYVGVPMSRDRWNAFTERLKSLNLYDDFNKSIL